LKQRVFLSALFSLFWVWAISQTPVVNFRSDIVSGCTPIVVKFKNTSTGDTTGATWLWDLGNGSTSSLYDASNSYTEPGKYTIKLTVKNANGTDSIVKTDFITVYPKPVAKFEAEKLNACFPASVAFFDRSTSSIESVITGWNWDFGDGSTSKEQNPVHVYRNEGSFNVSLQVTTDKGCSDVGAVASYIKITKGVVPNFTFVDPKVCMAPATVYFTDNSTGPSTGTLTSVWNYGNGKSDDLGRTVYETNGTYKITLYVVSSEGCQDSISKQIVVGKVITDITIPDKICPESPVSFINNSAPRPISAKWSFSNGKTDTLRNTTNSFAGGGTYWVEVINTYAACVDTFRKEFVVLAPPTIDFTAANTASCRPPFTPNFVNNSNGGVAYTWNFGDGSGATQLPHTYNSYGSFDVTLIAQNAAGCSDSLKKRDFIKIQKPVVSFVDGQKGGCAPFLASFKAAVETPDEVVSYQWNFGDGTTSNLPEPTHTYANTGTYTTTLTITTSTGCAETITLEDAVKVGTKPSASFTGAPRDVCANIPVQFTSITSEPVDGWKWFFGDGGTSNVKDPAYVFSDTGYLDVGLVVFNNGCPSDTVTIRNYVHIKPPIPTFSFQPNCNNKLEYTYTNNSLYDKSLSPTTWQWNFGDGTTGTGFNPPPHTYKGLGTYVVTLSVTNGDCSNATSQTIVISDLTPDFSTSTAEGCKSFTATITAEAPSPQLIASYAWDFGDGVVRDFGANPVGVFTYEKSGKYDVTLIATDVYGCKYTVKKAAFITVNGPIANFTSNNNSGCEGLVTNFVDVTETDGRNKIVQWDWNFGDGTMQTYLQPPFTHQYDSLADYDVTLTVTDAAGCTDKVQYLAFIKLSRIKADFSTPGLTCPQAPTPFTNLSKGDFKYTSVWTYGDGESQQITNPAAAQNGVHKYADTGLYTVQLKVRDMFGCEDSITKINAVRVSVPKASFNSNTLVTYCTPFEAKFTNTSTFYASSYWSLGEGFSTLQNPVTFYTKKGVYEVKLTITSPGGCTDDTTQLITVKSPSDAAINYGPLEGCIPITVNFSAFTKMNARFIWDFGDGNVVDTTVNEIEHVYRDFGEKIPKIILEELETPCKISVTGVKPINLVGVKNAFTIDKFFFCDNGLIKIEDSTTFNDAIKDYKWNFGDGTTFDGPRPGEHNYKSPGLYSISLIVNTAAGCTDTLVKGPIKVVESPVIDVRTKQEICLNDTLTHYGVLTNPDTSIVRWAWNLPNGNNPALQITPLQKYTTAGNFLMTTVATNGDGCADTVVKSLLVNPLPVVTVPPVLTKVAGAPLTIPATYGNGIVSYLWTPDSTLSCATCPQPVTTSKFDTKYKIAVTDTNGCINTAEVQLIVTCKGSRIFLPNTFSPNGDGANDMFYPRGTGLDRIKSLRIFNRWGEVVYEAKDFPVNSVSFGWNGMYKGKPALPDVYVYQLEIFCENSDVLKFDGNIALIR